MKKEITYDNKTSTEVNEIELTSEQNIGEIEIVNKKNLLKLNKVTLKRLSKLLPMFLAFIIFGIGIYLNFIKKDSNDTTNKSEEIAESYPILNETQSEESETLCDPKSYKNANYPRFSFKYDGCDWKLTEKKIASTYKYNMPSYTQPNSYTMYYSAISKFPAYEVKLTNTKGDSLYFYLELYYFGEGFGYCTKADYKVLDKNGGRIKEDFDDKKRGINFTYSYIRSIFPKGTKDFDTIYSSQMSNKKPDSNVCTGRGYNVGGYSTYGTGDNYSPKSSNLDFQGVGSLTEIYYVDKSGSKDTIGKADKVVESMTY